jgi:chloramphenicol O-acetyltransferase type A
MARPVDLEGWKRREHYRFFRGYEQPFFTLCAEVDVTGAWETCRRPGGPSFFLATLFLSLRAANGVPEMRYRLRADGVVEHQTIHGGSTVMRQDETFGFGYFDYRPRFADFAPDAGAEVERVRRDTGPLRTHRERDDLIYYSVIPWVAFTSFAHARRADPLDSVPRIVFGKAAERGGRRRMPVSVELHHALADGLHAGRFFTGFQAGLDEPALLDPA